MPRGLNDSFYPILTSTFFFNLLRQVLVYDPALSFTLQSLS